MIEFLPRYGPSSKKCFSALISILATSHFFYISAGIALTKYNVETPWGNDSWNSSVSGVLASHELPRAKQPSVAKENLEYFISCQYSALGDYLHSSATQRNLNNESKRLWSGEVQLSFVVVVVFFVFFPFHLFFDRAIRSETHWKGGVPCGINAAVSRASETWGYFVIFSPLLLKFIDSISEVSVAIGTVASVAVCSCWFEFIKQTIDSESVHETKVPYHYSDSPVGCKTFSYS